MAPPLGDIAHLGHAELLTPDLDASVRFFTDYLGLTVNGRAGDSVYLRTFDDYEHHSLVLTAHASAGPPPHRPATSSEEALQRRVKETEDAGRPGRWVEDEPGIGKLYVTTDPDGHELALYWESEYYRAPDELKPGAEEPAAGKAQPGRGRTAPGPRQLPRRRRRAQRRLPATSVLGARPTEQIRLDSGRIAAQWLTFTQQVVRRRLHLGLDRLQRTPAPHRVRHGHP